MSNEREKFDDWFRKTRYMMPKYDAMLDAWNARAALAAYEQAKAMFPKSVSGTSEPVAWIPADALAQLKDPLLLLRNVPLYAYAGEDLVPLYAAPVAEAEPRKPLTVPQIHDLCDECDLDWHRGWAIDQEPNRYLRLARAIEAAHGIKEQP